MSFDLDVSSAEFRAASSTYSLLARLWLREVDAPFLAQLRETDLGEAFQAAGGRVPQVGELDELAAEYCRLFVGPRNHLPPLQSVWQRGELQSEITSSIRSFAEAIFFDSPLNAGSVMYDHLGTELDIMSQITATVSTETCVESRALASEFFRRHLTWTDKLIQQAIGREPGPFYLSLLRMTRMFLDTEAAIWRA